MYDAALRRIVSLVIYMALKIIFYILLSFSSFGEQQNTPPDEDKEKDMNYRKLTKNELITLLELHDNPVQVKDPKSVYDYLKPYGKEPQEHFIVLMVDSAFNVRNVKVVTIGIANRCLVHPREVFAPAIEARCSAIFIAHNHPSGNLTPSEEDIELSDRLAKAGRILGIQVIDHFIFSSDDYYSMRENGDFVFGC